jgi:hypothetical protein
VVSLDADLYRQGRPHFRTGAAPSRPRMIRASRLRLGRLDELFPPVPARERWRDLNFWKR